MIKDKRIILSIIIIILSVLVTSYSTINQPNHHVTTLNENRGGGGGEDKVILIMTYKRVDEFKACLNSLIKANKSNQHHLVITQSVGDNDTTYYDQIQSILDNQLIVNHFKSINHISTPTKCKLKFGNAYNAFKNLVFGLEYSLKSFSNLKNLIIIEEDIDLSNDIIEFFDKSRQLINQDGEGGGMNIKFATSAFFLHTTHPQYDWRVDKPIKRKSIRNELSLSLLNPKEIVKVRFQGQIEFKVLAWMIHTSAIQTIIQDFKLIQDWVNLNGEEIIENKVNTPKPKILIDNCDCWNHDRYLELRFKDNYFIGSQSPRCNHMTGEGLSNPGDDYGFPVNQNYTKKDDFQLTEINGDKGLWNGLKEYLPQFECKNRIDCYESLDDGSKGEYCGPLTLSTCLDAWNLECRPCSGRPLTYLEPQCNEKFLQCCKGNCTTKSPFFIGLP